MGIWRALGIVLALWVGVGSVAAQQTYPLAETVTPGDCFRVEIAMELSGELRVNKDGKTVPLKLSAAGHHEFPERILNVSATGLPERSARVYETAKATITVEGSKAQRALRPERRLMVAQRVKDEPLVYSPTGPLMREEVELIGEHFDTLHLPGLLPGKSVAVGDTWKVPNSVVQALCHFEGLTQQDLTCKLEKIDNKKAHISVVGSASGIDMGAQAKLKIQASCQFDLDLNRLVQVEWKQQDDRDQGPASPASGVQATTSIKRFPIDEPKVLTNVALVSVPDELKPAEAMVHLEYREPQNRFDLVHGREWHLVSQTNSHVVLRMLDRGDFVAQLTVTPWTAAPPGKHLTPEEFKLAMQKTPGWDPEQELQAAEVPTEQGDGRWIYRLSVLGKLDDMPVLQNFYLVAAPNGEQVVLCFTMSPKQGDRLGSRDLSMVGSLDFPSGRKEKQR